MLQKVAPYASKSSTVCFKITENSIDSKHVVISYNLHGMEVIDNIYCQIYLTVENDGVPNVDIVDLLGHVHKVGGSVHRQVVPGSILQYSKRTLLGDTRYRVQIYKLKGKQ